LPLGNFETTRLLIPLAIIPIVIAWAILTKPAAGVIATRPVTAPTQAPIAESLFPRILSRKTQVNAAVAPAVVVVPRAWTAISLAPNAEPALKPNYPNQDNPVPNII
jgi:hypothetical protein